MRSACAASIPRRGPARHGRRDQPRRRTIRATAPHGLQGADILLAAALRRGDENLLLAAVLASGRTTNPQCRTRAGDRRLAACLRRWRAYCRHRQPYADDRRRSALAGAVHAVLARPDRVRHAGLRRGRDRRRAVCHSGRIDLLGAAAPLFDAAGVAMREVEGGVIAGARRPACAASMSRRALTRIRD